MVLMYDSVTPSAIPSNAAAVAGYVDGAYRWSDADWARFPGAVKVRIAVFPWTPDGHVLDVERGDATPGQAPGWVAMRQRAGLKQPQIYCNASTLPAVRAAFAAVAMPVPPIWVAQYDGVPTIPAGCVAKQYADPPSSGGNYDVSNVSQAFLDAVTGGTVTAPSANDNATTLINWPLATPEAPAGTKGRQLGDVWADAERVKDLTNGTVIPLLKAIQAAVTQTDADVKTSTSSILAAVAAGVQVTLTAEQAAQIEAQLAHALPGYVVNITPAPAAN
jgi:hypothetical protein